MKRLSSTKAGLKKALLIKTACKDRIYDLSKASAVELTFATGNTT